MTIADAALAEAASAGRRPTISELAARFDVSEGTAARALQERHIHPKRNTKLEQLQPRARKVLDLLVRCVPVNTTRVFVADEVTAHVFGPPASEVSRRQNRKRFKDALAELAAVSYHGHIEKNLIVIRHGRRFKDGDGSLAVGMALQGRSALHHLPHLADHVALDSAVEGNELAA